MVRLQAFLTNNIIHIIFDHVLPTCTGNVNLS